MPNKSCWQILIAAILLISCRGESVDPNQSIANTSTATTSLSIDIANGEEGLITELREFKTEQILQQNCGGSAEVENAVERERIIAHTIEVGAGFSANASGRVGISGTNVELGTEIASQLGYSYGIEESLSRSVTVKARAGTNMQHEIIHKEVWTIGNALIEINGEETIVPFSFRTDFSLELGESNDLGCPQPTQNETLDPTPPTLPASRPPTPISSTQTPSPTSTETPIPPTNTPLPTPTATNTITITPISQNSITLVGDIREIPAPPSVKPEEYEDSKFIVIFQEVQQFELTNPITVDVSEPGAYNSRDDRTPDIIREGTIIDSYFIHLDPIGTSPIVELKGTITFNNRIIGIILLADPLNESDLIIGIGTNTEYPTGGVDRRFEFGDDRLVVSEDMRTINIELIAGSNRDQIRVITESSAQ